MVREIAITIYLILFKLIFNIFKIFSLKDKVVFVVTFGDNSKYVYDEIRKRNTGTETVVLFKGTSHLHFRSYQDLTLIPFETINIISQVKSIYHLATSKYIFVDNYFGFLAETKFKPEVECIQLWHASGAIKKFGLQDESIKARSPKAKQRFLKVYEKFDRVVVGSDVMANIFKEAFNLSNEKIVRTGIPRTDFFFDKKRQNEVISAFYSKYPNMKAKKKILYAPTYRDNEIDSFKLKLELDKMQDELGEDFVLLLRLHPAVRNNSDYSQVYPGFVYDFSSTEFDINELLLLTDFLITDYSSVPYDFSLLGKPMIFFAYDLEEYKKERGLWDQYETMLPGPVVKETKEIIIAIKNNNFNVEEIKRYSKKWNKYSIGSSSENLVDFLFEKEPSKVYQTEKASYY
ncbi:CDP-glycerol glycerophosphotransferase family protein [Cytobacillus sp. FSL R5-0596]|uniref:CDP-glycerol glycerophosphotransferase family protein n=1 Tax=Cytobacillus sp. FSL R5-0596 TaxID=2954696 RepID=UPI0030F69B7D